MVYKVIIDMVELVLMASGMQPDIIVKSPENRVLVGLLKHFEEVRKIRRLFHLIMVLLVFFAPTCRSPIQLNPCFPF